MRSYRTVRAQLSFVCVSKKERRPPHAYLRLLLRPRQLLPAPPERLFARPLAPARGRPGEPDPQPPPRVDVCDTSSRRRRCRDGKQLCSEINYRRGPKKSSYSTVRVSMSYGFSTRHHLRVTRSRPSRAARRAPAPAPRSARRSDARGASTRPRRSPFSRRTAGRDDIRRRARAQSVRLA